MLLTWISFGLVDYFASPEIMFTAFLVRYAFLMPLFLVFYLLRNKKSASKLLAQFPSFTIFVGTAHVLFLGAMLHNSIGMLWRIFPIVFITLIPLMSGFTPIKTLVHGAVILLMFLFVESTWSHDDQPAFVFLMATITISSVVSALGSLLLHRVRRNSYWKSLVIDWQFKQLEVAHEKSDKLLENMLPIPIASRLKETEKTIADQHDSVAVLFADLVGFTTLSSTIHPEQLVNGLNTIFSAFDKMTEKLGLEKIKTIGDAYMVCSGLEDDDPEHLKRLVEMAFKMQGFMDSDELHFGAPITIRIGIHIGPVIAGVIGVKKFVYDLWGDTVNTASRMESQGVPRKIQISEQTKIALGDDYQIQERGIINIKGKGEMLTYFLSEKNKIQEVSPT